MKRLIAAFALLFSVQAFAIESYDWVPLNTGDLEMIRTAERDLQIRLDLIRSARKSIDLVIYEQAADPYVGLPILSALRDAADRGVKIRFITSFIAQYYKDRHKSAEQYLVEPPTREPIQVVIFGGEEGRKHGFQMKDSIHEKLLLVDGETVLATGRGQSDSYIHWLDTSFLIRGALVPETARAIESLWRTVTGKFPLFSVQADPKVKVESLPEKHEVLPSMVPAADDLAATPELSAGARARVLHFDMVQQIVDRGGKVRRNIYKRTAQFTDPVIDAIVEKIRTAREVRYTTLSSILNPRLKAAILEAAGRGARITIQTNGANSYLGPSNLPYDAALGDMKDLLENPNIRIFGFEPGASNPWTYLHRKLAVVDDTVFFGSHNLNLPSSVTNDEVSFEVEDPGFARMMRDRFDQDLAVSSPEISLEEVRKEWRTKFYLRWFAAPFVGLF